LRAHILEPITQFNFLGAGDAVLRQAWCAVELAEEHIAAFRTERHLCGVGEEGEATRYAVARRSWSRDEKASIIAESYSAGETVWAVARRHGLTPQQLFAWRRLARRSSSALPPAFVPAVVEAPAFEPPAITRTRRVRRRSKPDGIELEIAGVEVRVGADA
jgi:transposase